MSEAVESGLTIARRGAHVPPSAFARWRERGLVEFSLLLMWFATLTASLPVLAPIRYLAGLGLIYTAYRRRDAILDLARRFALPLAVPAYVLFSCLWSPAPAAGGWFAALMALSLLVCMVASTTVTYRQVLIFLMLAGLFAAMLSVLNLNVISIEAGRQEAALGVFAQKNRLGTRMQMLALVAVAIALDRGFSGLWRVIAVAAMPLAAYLVVESNSATATIQTGLGVVLLAALALFWEPLKAQQGARIFFFAMLIVAFGLAALTIIASVGDPYGSFLGLFGKNDTLTGRTAIWDYGVEFLQGRPWTGYGAEGFWRPQEDSALQLSMRFMRVEGGYTLTFHNAFLEAGVHLGYPGMILFIAATVWGLGVVLADFLRWQDRQGAIFMIMASLIAMRAFVETDLYSSADPNLMLFWMPVCFALVRGGKAPQGAAAMPLPPQARRRQLRVRS